MSGFVGIGGYGVWISNGEMDDLLSWFAQHRFGPQDSCWERLTHESHRWAGNSLDLETDGLFPNGAIFEVSAEERQLASETMWRDAGPLLHVVSLITKREWPFHMSDGHCPEASAWRAQFRL